MFEKKVLQETANEIINLQTHLKEKANDYEAYYWRNQGWRIQETLTNLVNESVSKDQLIVDIGCNPPFMLATLRKCEYKAIGVDINPHSFKKSIEQYDLSVIECDIENQGLPFEDNSIDVIVLAEVFEHLRINPLWTLQETYRVLRPKGFLLLSTPNLRSLKGIYNFLIKGVCYSCASNVFREFNTINTLGYFGHMREYTWQEINLLIKKIGYHKTKLIFAGGANQNAFLTPIYLLAPSLRPSLHIVAFKPSPE